MNTVKNFLLTSSIITLVLVASSCGKNAADTKAKEDSVKAAIQNVKVVAIQQVSIDRRTNYATTLEGIEQVNLVPTMPGKIQKINVEVGARVSKGQTLVEMDQTNLYSARVQLANLKTEFNRMKILLESGSISKQAYDQMKAQYDVAEANVENLERNTNIRAPFSGVISGKYLEAGEMYSGAPTTPTGKTAIVSLVQISTLKAMVNIPESYYPNIKEGQLVTITSSLYPEKEIIGKIIRVYPTIDPTSHSFQVEINIPNASELLKPGMYCTASVDMGKVEAVLIPSQAILKTQGSNERFIFVNNNGKALKVKVLLGQRVDDQVEIITEQVKVGDLLVVEGQGRLKNGNKLKVVK
jgi:membrane fusion protein (multidrug efflux system)